MNVSSAENHTVCRGRQQQRGAVLIVALILVGALTLIALVTIDSGGKQTRMVANSQSRIVAMESAEIGLIEAEKLIGAIGFTESQLTNESCVDNCFESTCSDGLCFSGTNPDADDGTCALNAQDTPIWLNANFGGSNQSVWQDANKHRVINLPASGTSVKYIVEFRCYIPESATGDFSDPTKVHRLFRITSLATTDSGRSRVMLQSTYSVNN